MEEGEELKAEMGTAVLEEGPEAGGPKDWTGKRRLVRALGVGSMSLQVRF